MRRGPARWYSARRRARQARTGCASHGDWRRQADYLLRQPVSLLLVNVAWLVDDELGLEPLGQEKALHGLVPQRRGASRAARGFRDGLGRRGAMRRSYHLKLGLEVKMRQGSLSLRLRD